MATVTKPIALDESINTTEQTPRNIADVLAEELKGIADNILPPNASQIAYDNTASGLTATNVQDAIDEVISSQADVIADTMADLTENKTAVVTDGVADFETIDGSLVKSLVVEIEPSQSGSGTPSPSNIRPISGYTQEDVTVVGKNRLEVSATSQTINGVTFTVNSDGTILADGTATAEIRLVLSTLSNLQNGNYIFSGCPSGGGVSTYYLQLVKSPAPSIIDVGNGNTFEKGSSYTVNNIRIIINNGVTVNNLLFKPMIRLATDTDSTFEPYHGKTYTTAFNQTVYGGTLDVLTGELTITHGFITVNGTENIGKSTLTNCDIYIFGVVGADFSKPFITSAFEYSATAVNAIGYTWRGSSDVQMRMGYAPYGTTTVDDFKDWLSQNPLQICYTLATPTTLSLTPQTVKALVGENHMQASTGDVLECKFSMLINGDDLEMLLS